MTNIAEHPLALWAWLIAITVLLLGVAGVMIWDSFARASKTVAQPPSVGTVRGTLTLDTTEFEKQMARVRTQAAALKAKYPAAYELLGAEYGVTAEGAAKTATPPAVGDWSATANVGRGRSEFTKDTDQAIDLANS